MVTVAKTGETRQGLPMAYLEESASEGQSRFVFCKVYPNEAGDKLRIVLPELRSFRQTRIDTESHYIEFTRSTK